MGSVTLMLYVAPRPFLFLEPTLVVVVVVEACLGTISISEGYGGASSAIASCLTNGSS